MSSVPPDTPASRADEFALLVDAVEDYALFLLSPRGEIRSWNRGAARIMGYTESEVLGKHFSIFYGPEEMEAEKPRRELETASSEGRVEDEGWRVRKDGTRLWANTVITSMRDSSGELRGFAKVTRDMTERRAAQQRLFEISETLQLLISSVREYAIFMLDPQGNVATWNSGAEKMKGYTPEEIIGQHFSKFYTEEDLRDGKPERELRLAREHGSVEDEGIRVRKDGTHFWANVVMTAIRDNEGTLRGFAKVTRDITERRKAEEIQHALLEQREARLKAEEERRRVEASYQVSQEANRAKDEFLMTLSHELRTPMTSILGWARLLPKMSPEDPLFVEAVASIAGGAQLQARLIDDILDVSRIVSGKLRLSPEIIDLARLILSVVDAVSPTADAKEITITTALAPALGTIVADATRIQQVVWNLVSNAVKFTPRMGNVQVSARRTASKLQIEVKDSGEGIEPAFLAHVFEPFRQAETPQTRVHGGLGLGLSIVRYIAEAHGGTVTAESEGKGKGATFTVTLPVRAVSTSTAGSSKKNHGMGLPPDQLAGLSIVLVDDDNEARKMVAAVLRGAGASVAAFESAMAALAAIDERPPHMVITDIAMPEVDGYALVREIRARPYGADLKIVALTAFPAGREQRSGFDTYLSKPIDPFHLVDEIARVAPHPAPDSNGEGSKPGKKASTS